MPPSGQIIHKNKHLFPLPIEGWFPNGERSSCFLCKADEIVYYDGSCKRCPDGLIPNENHRFCVACPKSLIANGGVCISCPKPEKE